MRAAFFVVVAGLALVAAGCGLDSSGLGVEDSGPLDDAGPPFDGTTGNDDANGAQDGPTPPSEAGQNDSSSEDVAIPEDAPGDVESEDSGTDAGVDSGGDTGTDAGIDAGADAAPDAGDDTGADSGVDSGVDSGASDSGADAGDAACSGACTVSAIPAGWSIAEYAETSRPACSTGYGSAVDVFEGPSGTPASCGCACDVTTAGTCMSGNFSVTANDGILPGCTSASVTTPANGGACSPAKVNWSPPANPMMDVTSVGYTAGACTPDSSVTTTPVTYTGQGELCSSTSSPGGACPNGGSCVSPPQGFSLCIVHSGGAACPAGFTNPAHTVGTGIADSRSCSACTCGGISGTCANQSLTLFTDPTCTTGAESVVADGMCDAFPGPSGGGAPTYDAYEYTATVGEEGCPASSVSAQGSVTLTGVETVCCQN